MYEVWMMGVPYLHEDLLEGEFDTFEEAEEHADSMVFECYVMFNNQILYNNGMPNAEEFEIEDFN
jgi:hypothetical protein